MPYVLLEQLAACVPTPTTGPRLPTIWSTECQQLNPLIGNQAGRSLTSHVVLEGLMY